MLIRLNWKKFKHKKTFDNALAYGEATGHAHRLKEGKWEMFTEEEWSDARKAVDEILVRVTEKCLADHEEHEIVDLEIGDHIVVIQHEVDHLLREQRRVAD